MTVGTASLPGVGDHSPSGVLGRRLRHAVGRTFTYAVLLAWAFVCLFPIYWTFTTSLKDQAGVLQGSTYVPGVDFSPSRIGWDSILGSEDQRATLIRNTRNSLLIAIASASVAVVLGAMAGYGLARFPYRFGPWRNRDISFWFLSQLILPPAAVVMPILILYGWLDLLDTQVGLIILYTVVSLPIVIWIMRDQFNSIPVELEQAALVDGATLFGAFVRIVIPIAAPGLVAAFILSVIFSWNEYFFAAVLSATRAVTLPLLVATQVSSQGIRWWAMAAVASASILPLTIVGILLERYIVKGLTAGAVK
ncbi:MAG: ABC transporter, permease protein 2 (cluster 1, maltose/g3p/polyamine/iron) [uncultured Thermomicrobiales bacterium]|uniref:Maltose/maltodextrin transport system permease protein MalG n=1 Tax=uncultured Thermomicrobiales bacterium TaxID=1645740 RepID=A0A6J4UAP8_9BACT|nr:MAG: ABC transporter, permease protein 2 (cluster 1, maltose/g3p/polyamine/iron) [uncultured Thermomicrobiales bacterium]